MTLHAIGIDIGGTKIAGALVSPEGTVIRPLTVPTPVKDGAPGILQAVIDVCRRLLDTAREENIAVGAVGVGTAGQVDHARGVISYAGDNLPGWTGVRLGEELQAALDLPASIDNDVNTLALGETRFGAGRGFDSILYAAVGTGIGGAVVFNGELWRGATWTAGEIGHMIIDWDGRRRCSCGEPGHLEAYTCGPAMAVRYCELAGVAPNGGDLRVVAEAARGGDPLALQAIEEGARILGVAMGGLLNVFDAEALIVGGGVPDLGDLWWIPFESALRANPMPGPAKVALRKAELGGHAVLIGAAWLAMQEYILRLM